MFLCSLNKNPEVELLDRMVVLFLILFSIVAVPIYIPINSAQGFPFLHTLASICHLLGFCLFVCFVSRYFLISSVISWLLSGILFSLHVFVFFTDFFL